MLLGAKGPAAEARPVPRVRVEHLDLHVAKGCNLRCSPRRGLIPSSGG